jgi:hypothetical protein
MNGYVRNKSSVWRHAMKRTVGPNAKIKLDELYEQYGKKHDLQEGVPFVEWLKNVKLVDSQVWEIVYSEKSKSEKIDKNVAENIELPQGVGEVKSSNASNTVTPFVKSEKTPADIINMTVREARQELKKITDINLLKYAYNEIRQLSNKDTMIVLLRRRIQELELTRR